MIPQSLVVLSIAAFALGCRPKAEQLPSIPALPPDARIDPAVRATIDSGKTAQVVVLGRTQLFAPVGGLETFQRQNANADRLDLRKRVVATLKSNAQREQSAILRALGRSSPTRSLWIVNAMVLSLSPDEVRRVAQLPEVQFIYPTGERIGAQQSPGNVTIVPPVEPRPFSPTGKRIAWNVTLLGAPRVWEELRVTGEGATVAVLDFGVNHAHQDLRANLWRNAREVPANGVDDDRNGYIDDIYGYDFAAMRSDIRDTTPPFQHATVVSGIVAGDGTGGIVTGVAPRARLMMMRGNGTTAAALAYQYAIENGADILSMSFSLPNQGNVRGYWRMMSDHAVAAGLLLVGGAGNFRTSAQIPTQHWAPKDAPSVISVGGVDSTMRIVPFSSGGPVEWSTVALYGDFPLPHGLTKPDVVAFPGSGYPVLGAGNTGYVDPNESIRGNSFSGPQGAGVAALMMAAAPRLPAWRVRELMEQTARDLGPPGKDNDFGAGLLDAYRAVQAVQNKGF